jgi:hypothetical protein
MDKTNSSNDMMIYDANATHQKRIFLKANKPPGLSFSMQ